MDSIINHHAGIVENHFCSHSEAGTLQTLEEIGGGGRLTQGSWPNVSGVGTSPSHEFSSVQEYKDSSLDLKEWSLVNILLLKRLK